MNQLYLWLDVGAIAVPLAASFHPRLQFYKSWLALWSAIILSMIPFIWWDVKFTEMEVWGFNDRYLTGVEIINLPIEEWGFFICIPYACVFTYFCFKKLLTRSFESWGNRMLQWVMSGICLIVALLFYDRWYTVITFSSLAIFLFIGRSVLGKNYGLFLFTYLIITIPFFLINGTLTGNFIEDQVVWYNDLENMGIRMTNIPVEDLFYGMLHILLNIVLFEIIEGKLKSTSRSVVN